MDIDSDSGVILEQYATKKYENSLSYCYPDIAAEWHPTKNGRLTPDRISKASRRNVWWLGKCGHEWQAVVSERTAPEKILKNGRTRKPYGCPYCSGKRILVGFNDLQSLFPEIAAEWHPTKNGSLKPADVTCATNKRIWWQCKECGHQQYLFANTIFQDNKLDLYKLLLGLFLFFNNSKGISAMDMKSHLDVNYKTALLLCRPHT